MLRQWPSTSQRPCSSSRSRMRSGASSARQRLNRAQFTRFLAETPATHVVMEACGMAHYWGRVAQQHGHRVTLVPPAYVRPYVRRNKTDRADAEAILEAVRSGEMPSVPVKRVEQQALVALHRVREQWMTTRTARINTLRGILREHGLLLPAGARAALQAVPTILDEAETPLPLHLRTVLDRASMRRSGRSRRASRTLERELRALADADPVVTRLRTIPGIGAVDRDGAGRQRRAHPRVSPRAAVCQLAGADAARALEWHAAPARRHQQTRRRLSPLPAHAWRSRRPGRRPTVAEPRRPAAHAAASLGADRARASRPQQSDDRRREQTRTDRLGRLAQRRAVRRAGRRLNGIVTLPPEMLSE